MMECGTLLDYASVYLRDGVVTKPMLLSAQLGCDFVEAVAHQ